MTLFKISLQNIKKSFKDYTIYFFTLILGVSIFYIFNAIESQTILLDVSSSTHELIDLMNSMLSGVSVLVAFILGFLIIYASRFLMKRRHKEFAIYLTLGMSKGKISLILFFETIIIGLISLVIGLLAGSALSQLMSIFVANMFDADMTKYEFIFSTSACLKTLIYFGIIYLIVILFNVVNIGKCKLIDLLQASKKSEKVKIKNPYLCTIIFFISAIALGYAYYMVTGGVADLDYANEILIPIAIGAVSTFLIFWSLSGLVLKIVMSIKGLYFKGLNCFTLRQISSKINTTVFSMTFICLMLFVTICLLSSALSLKNSMTANFEELAPADIQLTKKMNFDKETYLNQGYSLEQIENSKLNIEDTLKQFDFNIDDYLQEKVEYNIYNSEDLKFKDTLGSKYKEVEEKYKSLISYEVEEPIIKISDYNKIAKIYGNETYTLNEDEYMIIADFDTMVEIRNVALKNNETITVFSKTLKPKYNECKIGFDEMSSNNINTGLIIVSDDVVDENAVAYNSIIGNYKGDKKEVDKVVINKLNSLIDNPLSSKYVLPSGSTRLAIIEASTGLGALVTFIGLYIGIIFLIASAGILALKELTESTDNKERFEILRKIGTDEKMINRALFRQILIFFMFPLVLAIIHSIFGIMFSSYIISTFGNKELLPSIITTAIFLIVIYGGYFLITYYCSKNIIKDQTK